MCAGLGAADIVSQETESIFGINLDPALSLYSWLFNQFTMADAEGISLEETNKIRISLGLKPLTDDKAPVADKEKEAEDNYAKARQREVKEKNDKSVQYFIYVWCCANHFSVLQGTSRQNSKVSRLSFCIITLFISLSRWRIGNSLFVTFYRVRNKRELNARLKGVTLGDVKEGEEDTMAWIKRSKKITKQMAKRKEQELEEMDKLFQANYDEGKLLYGNVWTALLMIWCRWPWRPQSKPWFRRNGRGWRTDLDPQR